MDYIANLINAFRCARTSHTPNGCGFNFLTTAALPFSLAYFQGPGDEASVLPDASAIFWCERGRLLAPFSFGCKALTAWFTSGGVRWETAAFGLPLVGSWLVENTNADSWFENTVLLKC